MLPFLLAPLLALALSSTIPFSEESSEGLVVLEAPAPSSEAPAGPLPGDVLISWRRGGATGLLRWPSGLLEVETEQAPLGVVELIGRRAGQPRRWRMPQVRWGLRTRPALSPHLRALYREGAQRIANRDPEGGAESWRAAVEAASRAEDHPRTAWFLAEIGRAAAEAGRWKDADLAYEAAVARAEDTGMSSALLRDWCATYAQRKDWERAESCYRRVLAKAQPGTFTAARDLALLAGIAAHQGDLEGAERRYREALSIRAGIAVFGPYMVQIVRDEVGGFATPSPAGVTREEIEDLRRKLQRLRETLLAEAGLKPQGERPAKTAAAAPPKKAEPSPLETLKQALTKTERENPGSLPVSDSWQELGELYFEGKDLAAAEIAWLRALDLRERLAPGTLRETRTLHDLGRVHAQAGRDGAAASFLCRAARALDRRNYQAVGDLEARAVLGEDPVEYDRDCIAALVADRRPEEAFLTLERSRVRGGAAASIAPDLVRQRKEIEQDRAQTLTRLARLSTSRDRDEVDLLVAYAKELESRRDAIIRPLKLDNLRAALAPGTLLLAWSIGEEQSFLFAIHPAGAAGPGIEVFPVSAEGADLQARIPAFARHVDDVEVEPGWPRTEARTLYRQLFGPADTSVAAAQRLILVTDPALGGLPFGSLVQGEKLLEERARIEKAESATAWVEGTLTPGPSPASGRGE